MEIQLGPFKLDHPFILAPMAGITHSPFRRLMRRMGSSIVISELVSANGIEYGSKRTLELLNFHDDERIVGLQIFGEDSENLCRAAQYVEKQGADFIDLNLGCPVSKIVKKGAGSALCKNPAQLGKILEAMVRSVKIPVTIKIRTGWDAQTRNAEDVVQAAADAGIAWVAVHGRTRAQGYSGESDWEFIGKLKAGSSIPIIGNGDINTPEQAVGRYKDYGVDAVMIGRGALRNPFLFEQAKALLEGGECVRPKASDYLKLIDLLYGLLKSTFDQRLTLIHSRKFLSWYSSGFSGCHDFRKYVFSTDNLEQLICRAREFFLASEEARDQEFLSQPFLMGGHG